MTTPSKDEAIDRVEGEIHRVLVLIEGESLTNDIKAVCAQYRRMREALEKIRKIRSLDTCGCQVSTGYQCRCFDSDEGYEIALDFAIEIAQEALWRE